MLFKQPDELIKYGQSSLQYAALWLPMSAKYEQNKRIILIHRGCWLNAYDIKHNYALSTALAQDGYAVWSLEYRRTGDGGGGCPGSFNDILAGINYSKQHVHPAYSLANTIVIGHSAGGHLALLAGSQLPELKSVLYRVKCFRFSPLDLQAFALSKTDLIPTESCIFWLLGYKAANPLNYKMHANTVLLQGNADNIVPPEQATALGVPVVGNATAGHFDWIHPGSAAYQQLLNQLHDMFKQ